LREEVRHLGVEPRTPAAELQSRSTRTTPLYHE